MAVIGSELGAWAMGGDPHGSGASRNSRNLRNSLDGLDAALAAVTGVEADRSGDVVELARRAAGDAFVALIDALGRLPDGVVVGECSGFERQLMALRLAAVARTAGCSGDIGVDRRRARNVMAGSSDSRRSVGRDARRAVAVAANRRVAERLADGSVSPEAIDELLKAADESTGEIPDDLADAVAGVAVDQAARVVQEHLETVAQAGDVEERYRRQCEARRAYRYESPARSGRPALAGIALEGPAADIDVIWAQITSWADDAYQAAGGRGVAKVDHRPFGQRAHDAVVGRLTGAVTGVGEGRPHRCCHGAGRRVVR